MRRVKSPSLTGKRNNSTLTCARLEMIGVDLDEVFGKMLIYFLKKLYLNYFRCVFLHKFD